MRKLDTSTLPPIRHDPTRETVVIQADRKRLAREWEAIGFRSTAALIREGNGDMAHAPALRALARMRMEGEAAGG